ncbi:DpnII family type II restriction endonuclease [Mesomycoplasma lagogenitalium]|uniref:DpnII family type II restriction endonuclease n=1 Tax=Mesomycoplasma lagogenitalium TaxID=171286 RepID=A0ABY8LU79_9BACT|nr:DpnII family type II restriction endonuclease [Mesomycoplasma lagogenitalium]WGI36786.1 DpnII family type II restriction endonuclease [Mesomycoplasma lagogenitalium]
MNNLKQDEKLKLFIHTLLETNRDYDFYINWNNIDYYNEFKQELEWLNILIKNDDFDNQFSILLKNKPSIVKTFPLLFALGKKERDELVKKSKKFKLINSDDEFYFSENLENSTLTEKQISKYLIFFKKMGLKNLFMNFINSSVLDYVIGVLVGLDTNGRKNRSGINFESLCSNVIESICKKYDIFIKKQKNLKN